MVEAIDCCHFFGHQKAKSGLVAKYLFISEDLHKQCIHQYEVDWVISILDNGQKPSVLEPFYGRQRAEI